MPCAVTRVAATLLPPQPVSPMPANVRTSRESASRKRLLARWIDPKPAKIPANAARLRAPDEPSRNPGAPLFTDAVAVVVATTSVAVFVPPAASVTLAGFTVQDAFVGAPEQVSVTEPLNVALAVSVRVAMPLSPWVMVSDDGEAESVKAGVTEVTVTELAAEVFGLKLESPP